MLNEVVGFSVINLSFVSPVGTAPVRDLNVSRGRDPPLPSWAARFVQTEITICVRAQQAESPHPQGCHFMHVAYPAL